MAVYAFISININGSHNRRFEVLSLWHISRNYSIIVPARLQNMQANYKYTVVQITFSFKTMNTQIIDSIHSDQLQKRPEIQIGDTVKLHLRISEGDKSRVQVFEGIVISMKGHGLDAMITVRKISSGVGVERIIPLHSPTLEDVEVIKRGKVRRAKLYYMRDRVGKKAMKIKGTQQVSIKVEKEEEVVKEAATEEVVADGGEVDAKVEAKTEEKAEAKAEEK